MSEISREKINISRGTPSAENDYTYKESLLQPDGKSYELPKGFGLLSKEEQVAFFKEFNKAKNLSEIRQNTYKYISKANELFKNPKKALQNLKPKKPKTVVKPTDNNVVHNIVLDKTIKLPKNFNKLSLAEQEKYRLSLSRKQSKKSIKDTLTEIRDKIANITNPNRKLPTLQKTGKDEPFPGYNLLDKNTKDKYKIINNLGSSRKKELEITLQDIKNEAQSLFEKSILSKNTPKSHLFNNKYEKYYDKNLFEYKGSKKAEDYLTRKYDNSSVLFRKTPSTIMQKNLSIDDIVKRYDGYSVKLKSNVKSINISGKVPNIKKDGTISTYAKGFSKNRQVHILEAPRRYRPTTTKLDKLKTMDHEVFHIRDNFRLDGTYAKNHISNSLNYRNAVKNDTNFIKNKFTPKEIKELKDEGHIFETNDGNYMPTGYSRKFYNENLKTLSEDWAESGKQFLNDKGFKKLFPNRTKIIQQKIY